MTLQQDIQQLEQLIQFEKIILNSSYGINIPTNSYDKVSKYRERISYLKKLEQRINKINKIKENINEHKIQSLG